MHRAGEALGIRAKQSARRIAVAGIQFVESGTQTFEIPGIAGVNDVEVERRHWRPAEYGRHPADHNQIDVVPREGLKRVFEPGRADHGEAR